MCRAEERRGEERRGEERSCEIANNTCAIACTLCAERRGEIAWNPIRYRRGEAVVEGDLEIAGSGGEGRGDGEQELWEAGV